MFNIGVVIMKDDFVFRIKIVYALFFLAGALLVGRLFFVQVVKGEYYAERASRQYIAPSSGYFNRGTIYFKKKDGRLVSAAAVKKGFVLAINPEILKDPEDAYKKISGTTPTIDKEDFLRRASKKDDPYEEIIHKLSDEQADKIKNLKIKGVNVFSESWRFYPAKNLASRALGFVGYKGNELSGRYGLEKYHENILSRGNGDDEIDPDRLLREATDIFQTSPEIITMHVGKAERLHDTDATGLGYGSNQFRV